jgi:hypothetical protein
MRTGTPGGILVVLALVALAAGTLTTRADEEKIALNKLPKAVVDALKARYPKAELVSATTEKEKGETFYEVAIKDKDTKYDVTLKADGTITVIEKEITVKDLPKPVADALDAKYPKATIKRIEEVTEGEKVTYEVSLVSADKKTVGLEFDPKGKILEEKKKDEEKKPDEKKKDDKN